jgi:hypothetical protein
MFLKKLIEKECFIFFLTFHFIHDLLTYSFIDLLTHSLIHNTLPLPAFK